MPQPISDNEPGVIEGELFGVSVTLRAAGADVLARMSAWLPPSWRDGGSGVAPISFEIRADGLSEYRLLRDGQPADRGSLAEAIGSFELQLRNYVAEMAPDHVFIHAGTVAVGRRALLIPGGSFSGKTSLVTELVRAGAAYYSDEYAVFDRQGDVHPYPKPLAIRDGGGGFRGKTYHLPSELGAQVAEAPARVGLVLITQYVGGTEWSPERLTAAQAMMELIPHTFPSPAKAADTLATLAAGFGEDVIGLRGDRGDATEMVPELLALLEQD